ncbi:glycerol-3-phosphate 1-O-acyltransferase PlsY [Legionella jordanis]|uniref:Glycerol-3-phosphate acyltransferase n=1 Tax=Legionella jordanis TaxID=456 RepID=A0A0W0VCQ8_9GAMM|nr:glycerol-3-phosphate 1-O-acyltransferase PlsY [Legionella jordanis]KTD17385.1 transmembrane protein [Legionella jordanis]RMX01849.1 glycerol-3-phosphate 1-O-acyltransferase [Legionella jordanis]RMX17639.1 glycerol-3-phosphate 1-O-acyltransferase [Legionella jordanis]VEH11595.1 transmembrane protein [Legionella jordanis]HAT8714668.1 glycerol-3-phosphate 1-O-acyltransferase PlsY [Legionella jordanis]
MLSALLFLFVVVLGYLAGSICSAIVVSKLFSLPDPRTTGSKNPGATNVLRLAGRQYAAIVLVGDMLKGFLPVLLAGLLGAGPVTLGFTCFAAVLGHMFPAFFDFRGGKGVATALGALLGLHFILGVVVIATWLVVANFTRYSSLASIISMIMAPWYALFTPNGFLLFPPLFFITIFIIYKHRNNITRLMDHQEPKIGSRSASLEDEITETLIEEEQEEELEQNSTESAPQAPLTEHTAESEVINKPGNAG